MNTLRRFGLTAATVLMAALPAAARPITLEYKLPKKTPEVRPTVPPEVMAGVRLSLADTRTGDPGVVGSQREKTTDLYLWQAAQPIAPAVEGFVGVILRGWSVPVGAESGATLSMKLSRYWIDEKSVTFGSVYSAEVTLQVALVEAGGRTAWTREATGKAKREGVDARDFICNELLSLALRDALVQALGAAPAAASVAPSATTAASPALFDELVKMKSSGASDEALVAYVKEHKPSRALSVDEILAWKNAGLPDAAIRAASE